MEANVQSLAPPVEAAAREPAGRPTIGRSGIESARFLLNHLHELAPEARCVLVARLPVPGGSTMLGVDIATASALAGRRTALIDCDLACPALAAALDLDAGPGMTEYLTGTATPRQVLQPVDLRGAATGDERAGQLVCATAGEAVEDPGRLLASDRFERAIDRICRAYDLAVLLGGSPLDSEMGRLLRFADGVAPHRSGLVVLDRSAA